MLDALALFGGVALMAAGLGLLAWVGHRAWAAYRDRRQQGKQ